MRGIRREPFVQAASSSIALELPFLFCSLIPSPPAWRNWQTRWTQNPVLARVCGFDPLRRHTSRTAYYEGKLIKYYKQRIRTIAHENAQIHNLFVNNSSTKKTVTALFGRRCS